MVTATAVSVMKLGFTLWFTSGLRLLSYCTVFLTWTFFFNLAHFNAKTARSISAVLFRNALVRPHFDDGIVTYSYSHVIVVQQILSKLLVALPHPDGGVEVIRHRPSQLLAQVAQRNKSRSAQILLRRHHDPVCHHLSYIAKPSHWKRCIGNVVGVNL